MTRFYIQLILIIQLAAILLAAGCTTTPVSENLTGENHASITTTPGTPESKAFYKVTISQPNDANHPDYIKMESDVYNQGEVIEFYVVNEGSESLLCDYIPTFGVSQRMDDGSWRLLPESSQTASGGLRDWKPGEVSRTFRFATTGWMPGRYRIVFDCGIMREFEIWSVTT